MSRSVRAWRDRPAAAAEVLHAVAERRDDRRNGASQRDQARRPAPRRRRCSGCRRSRSRRRSSPSSILPLAGTGGNGTSMYCAHDREERQQHHPRQHAAGDHHAGDARADDVADAHVLGRDVGVQRRVGEERSAAPWCSRPRSASPGRSTSSDLPDRADPQAHEHGLGQLPPRSPAISTSAQAVPSG